MHITILDFNFFEYTTSLANAMVKRVQVTILVPDSFRNVASALSPEVNVIYFHKPRLRSLLNLKMIWEINQVLKQLQPDIVHLLAVNPWFNLMLLFHRPYRLVTTIHDPVKHMGDTSQKNIPQIVRDVVVFRSNKIITHAEALKEIILQRFKIPADQIAVIPHGEFSIYRHWKRETWPERDGNILFFGRIWPYKGLDYLISAGPAIRKECPRAWITIAGQGESLERYIAMMKHPDQFEILNHYISHAEVVRLFEQASVVVLPYVEASQSGVIPLAYAFGKPVVATAVGGISEVVTHGENGLLVPPRDSDALADALIMLLKDQKARTDMGQNALKKSENLLSWDNVAQKTEQVYWSMTKENSGRWSE